MSFETLPHNWSWVKLGDVVDNFKRGPFGSSIKKSFFVPQGYKVYEQKNAIYNSIELGNYFIDEQKFLELQGFEVGPGDFIVSCSGTIGKIYRLPPNASKGIINQALLRIRLKEKKILEKYFLELFKSYWFQKKMLVETRGSAMLNIAGVKELKQIPIPLPPLPEQKKIVEKIEELFSQLDSGVASLKKAKEQIRLYRQSVLASAFSGRLHQDSQDLKINKIKSQKKSSELINPENPKILVNPGSDNLPDGWKWVKLGEVSKVKGGKRLPKGEVYSEIETKFPYIRVTDFENMSVIISELRYLKKETQNQIRNYIINKDDLYISIAGTIGRVGLIPSQLDGANLTENAAKITEIKNYDLRFLSYQMNSSIVQNQIKILTISTTQPKLALFRIEKLDLVQPPIVEQTQIVEEIESRFAGSEALEKAIDDSLTKAETLRQSILKKAFEGRLI